MSTTYSQEQYELNYPDGIEYHWWNSYRSGFVARLCRDVLPPGAAVLEVGCGRGSVVWALRREGLDVRGVELAPVPPLPSVADHVVSGQDATTLPAAQRAGVRAILLLDVIEHLPDPAAFMAALQEAYPDLDIVIVAVPARQELWSNYDEFYGHFRRYTRLMLDELGATLGWERLRSGYYFRLLYIPVRLLCLLGVERGTALRAPTPGMRWLHALVAAYHRLEERLLPGFIPGTSAYAIYRVRRG